MTTRACDGCIRRSWLLARLGGHLENVRGRIELVLALADEDLIEAVAGRGRHEIERECSALDAGALRAQASAERLEAICRCDPAYPPRLLELASPPAVLYVAGALERFLELVSDDPAAVVGSRLASPYGLEVARALGRGVSCAGVTVISGMAHGVDSAAHAGALEAGGRTVAVLPGPANRAYPAARRPLHRRIVAAGAAISELPPTSAIWRWSFPARNRIIAGLAPLTVVVEAGMRSGALLTAAHAQALGRRVAAVPGRVTSPLAAGPNALLARGAALVHGPQDVLDLLFGAGVKSAAQSRLDELDPELRKLLAAIGEGHETAGALSRAGYGAEQGLAALAALELGGYIRRGAGGRFTVIP